jgi:starch synthase
MHIIQVAAEFAPLVKAGGLGEVIVGLSRQLTLLGHRVDVILPKYDLLPLKLLKNLRIETPHFDSIESGQKISNTMWSAEFENIRIHLLETHHKAAYFDRETIYGCEDDLARFLYFSRAVADYLKMKQTSVDILHTHDWHTAALAAMRWDNTSIKKTVLSIHNLEYQGKCGLRDLQQVNIREDLLQRFHGDSSDHPDSYNILRGGIEEADAIVPVSPSYAKEILTPEFGCGLNHILATKKNRITGILNGIDAVLWNPEKDLYLSTNFKKTDPVEKVIIAKRKNQDELKVKFVLKGSPWVGAITRIVPQKGPEFIEAAIQQTIDCGGTFLMLGSAPNPDLHRHFQYIKTKFKDCAQVLIQLDFDEALAHKLYASLDLLLIPSHFEPCGLAQMIGMHYGTVPIARMTGGLKDTVFESQDMDKWNGFTFDSRQACDFSRTLDRALTLKKEQPRIFEKIMSNGFKTDFSWKNPADQYLSLFKNLLERL